MISRADEATANTSNAHKKAGGSFSSSNLVIQHIITMATAFACENSAASADFVANLAAAGVENCPVSWSVGDVAASLVGRDSYFQGSTPLDTWVGYLVVIGFGALFSVFTTIVVYLDKTFAGNASMTSEHFK